MPWFIFFDLPSYIQTFHTHNYVVSPQWPPGMEEVFLQKEQRATLGHQASSHRCHCRQGANSPAFKVLSLVPAVSCSDTVEQLGFEPVTLFLVGVGHLKQKETDFQDKKGWKHTCVVRQRKTQLLFFYIKELNNRNICDSDIWRETICGICWGFTPKLFDHLALARHPNLH